MRRTVNAQMHHVLVSPRILFASRINGRFLPRCTPQLLTLERTSSLRVDGLWWIRGDFPGRFFPSKHGIARGIHRHPWESYNSLSWLTTIDLADALRNGKSDTLILDWSCRDRDGARMRNQANLFVVLLQPRFGVSDGTVRLVDWVRWDLEAFE